MASWIDIQEQVLALGRQTPIDRADSNAPDKVIVPDSLQPAHH
jgi:hypothetical protein